MRLAPWVRAVMGAPPRLGQVRLVAVDGASGSGKTVFAGQLRAALGTAGVRTGVVACDSFATWDNPVAWWPELESGVLAPLAAGRVGRFQATHWEGGQPLPGDVVEVAVPEVLIVEGVSSARRAVSDRLSLGLWLEGGSEEQRLAAAVARDGEESRDHLRRWQLFERGWFTVDNTESRCVVVPASAW